MKSRKDAAVLQHGGGLSGNGSYLTLAYCSRAAGKSQCVRHGSVSGGIWTKRVDRSLHLRQFPFPSWAFDYSHGRQLYVPLERWDAGTERPELAEPPATW